VLLRAFVLVVLLGMLVLVVLRRRIVELLGGGIFVFRIFVAAEQRNRTSSRVASTAPS